MTWMGGCCPQVAAATTIGKYLRGRSARRGRPSAPNVARCRTCGRYFPFVELVAHSSKCAAERERQLAEAAVRRVRAPARLPPGLGDHQLPLDSLPARLRMAYTAGQPPDLVAARKAPILHRVLDARGTAEAAPSAAGAAAERVHARGHAREGEGEGEEEEAAPPRRELLRPQDRPRWM